MAVREKSLSEQLIALTNPEPSPFDQLDEEHDGLSARLVSRYDLERETNQFEAEGRNCGGVFESGAIGRRAAAFVDEEDSRYVGKVTSRHKIREEWPLDEPSRGQARGSTHGRTRDISEDGLLDDMRAQDSAESDEDERSSSSDEERESETSDECVEDHEIEESVSSQQEIAGDVKHFSDQNLKEEMEKGLAVKSQLKLWDCFLEARIKLQRIVGISSRFPQQDTWDDFRLKGGPELMKQLQRSQTRLRTLLDSLLSLQERLLEQNKDSAQATLNQEHKDSKNTAVDPDEEIASDVDDEQSQDQTINGDMSDEMSSGGGESENKGDEEGDLLEKRKSSQHQQKRRRSWMLPHDVSYSQHVAKVRKSFDDYRDSVITKWDEKLRIATGKLSSKSFLAKDHSTMNHVRQIMSNKERLVKRTQLRRSSYRVMGKQTDQEDVADDRDAHLRDYDQEIFDDDDFYHQLLKELIERHASDTGDSTAMGRQWLEMQKLRSKVRKRVDTKASKGRRIRFDVHPKLQSFMAPVEQGSMPDSARNDLFSSLFGQQPVFSSADETL